MPTNTASAPAATSSIALPPPELRYVTGIRIDIRRACPSFMARFAKQVREADGAYSDVRGSYSTRHVNLRLDTEERRALAAAIMRNCDVTTVVFAASFDVPAGVRVINRAEHNGSFVTAARIYDKRFAMAEKRGWLNIPEATQLAAPEPAAETSKQRALRLLEVAEQLAADAAAVTGPLLPGVLKQLRSSLELL